MIQGKAKRKVYFGLCGILSFINKFIPKNDKAILFFSTTNLYDNSEALFKHFIDNGYNEKYQIICALKNPEDYKALGYKNVKFISVFASIWSIMRSKYIFYHNEMLAIMPTKKQVSVDFWHATTFKKINKTIDPDYRYDFFTYITATSELYRPIFAESFGCELERVIINGHPRNDYLFDDVDEISKLDVEPQKYNKIFVWMPTYRFSFNEVQRDTDWEFLTESGLPIFATISDVEALNEKLKENNSLLILKLHHAQNMEKFNYSSHSNILCLTNPELDEKGIHFYSLLKQTDALITDYSSVFFDYLLLDKPMAFTIDDIDSYSGNRGFVFDNPLDYMPGAKMKNADDFYKFIEDTVNGVDDYKAERADINEKVNFYKDDKSCERIIKFVGIEK